MTSMAQRCDVCLAPPTFQFFVGNKAVEGCIRDSHERTEVHKRINLLANQEGKHVYANSCEDPFLSELVQFLVGVIGHKQYFASS